MRAIAVIGGLAAIAVLVLGGPSAAPAARGSVELAFDRGGWIYVVQDDGSGVRRLVRGSGPAFSPDGSRLAFARQDRLYVARADGSGERELALAGRGYGVDWSPDGSKIAFTSHHRSGRFAVYVANADGTGVRRLVKPAHRLEESASPAWSPDGRLIAFASTRAAAGNPEIYVARPDGTGLRRLTHTAGDAHVLGDDGMPNWSRDGKQIVFTSNRTGGGAIWVMRADGTGERKVYDHKGSDAFDPKFSPDGRRIAFSRLGLGTTEVWIVGRDGRGARRVTAGGRPTWLPVRPSRAGSSVSEGLIAFARTTGTGASALYVVRPDGTGLRKISTAPVDLQPAWTPDGKRIVFASSRGGREGAPELYVRDLAGRTVVRLTRTPHSDADWAGNVEPSVSPDGARVVFVRESYRDRKWSRDLYSVALAGGPVRRLTRTNALEASPTIGRSGALYFERGGWIYETALGKTRRIARGVHPAKDPSAHGLVAFAFAGGIYVSRGGRPELVAAASEDGGLSQPSWSSDGERLVYVAPDGLFTVNVDGSDVRRLTRTSTLAHDVAPAWQPLQRSS